MIIVYFSDEKCPVSSLQLELCSNPRTCTGTVTPLPDTQPFFAFLHQILVQVRNLSVTYMYVNKVKNVKEFYFSKKKYFLNNLF